jgi:hypothetical protein
VIAPLKIRSHWELLITNSVRTQTLTIDLQENKFLFRFFFCKSIFHEARQKNIPFITTTTTTTTTAYIV